MPAGQTHTGIASPHSCPLPGLLYCSRWSEPCLKLLVQGHADAFEGWKTPSELPPEGPGPKFRCIRRKSEGCLYQRSSCGKTKVFRSCQEDTTDRVKIQDAMMDHKFSGPVGNPRTVWDDLGLLFCNRIHGVLRIFICECNCDIYFTVD